MENLKNKIFGDSDLNIGETSFPIQNPKFSGTKKIENPNGNTDLKKLTTTVSWVDRNEQTKTVMLETLIYNND